MNSNELKSKCIMGLKWDNMPGWIWTLLKTDGYISEVLSASDKQEERECFASLMKRAKFLKSAPSSSLRIRPAGREAPFTPYQPTDFEKVRQEALRQYYETNLNFEPRVIAFRADCLKGQNLSFTDAGKFLANPLNWLLNSKNIRVGELDPITDLAIPKLREYEISFVNGEQRAFHKITAIIPAKNLEFSAYHDFEDRIVLQRFYGRADAHAVKTSESISLRQFFEKHFHEKELFPAARDEKVDALLPFIFRKTLVGRSLEISQDLANVHGLDERDVLLFLLTGRLPAPLIISSYCRPVPLFDDDNQWSAQTTIGPIHITVSPQMSKQNVSKHFGEFQKNLLGKDNRPIENLDLFAFVIANRAEAKHRNEKTSWGNLRKKWEQSPVFAILGQRQRSDNGFRMAYVRAKEALLPVFGGKNSGDEKEKH